MRTKIVFKEITVLFPKIDLRSVQKGNDLAELAHFVTLYWLVD